MLKLFLQNVILRIKEWRSRVAERKRGYVLHERVQDWYRRDW